MGNVNVKKLGHKELQLNLEGNSVVNFYELETEEQAISNVVNHILLLDVSGSMQYELPELKVRVKEVLAQLKLKGNNYVSAITYSGHEESKIIFNSVKCDDVSYQMADIENILEKELVSKGITVMSEPLEKSISIVKKLSKVCNTHNVVLFTDGCLVPCNWSYKEEKQKCIKIAEICKDLGVYLNTIGFGNYYDRDFLVQLSQIAAKGNFAHINNLIDYTKTIEQFNKLYNNIIYLEKPIKLTTNPNSQIYLNGQLINGNEISIISRGKNYLAIIDDASQINIKLPKENEDILYSFLCTKALESIIKENLDLAEIILAQTKDIELFKSINNCYSFSEKGKVINKLIDYKENPSLRYQLGKKEIKIPSLEEEKICLLEILQEILEDKDSKLIWDNNYKYHRILQKTSVDSKYGIYFKRKDVPFSEVINVSIGSEKLNIGIKVKIPGTVIDKQSGLESNATIFRDYVLVKNGNINVSKLHCVLSKKLLDKYSLLGIIDYTSIVEQEGKKYNVSTIPLSLIRSTNKRTTMQIDKEELAESLYRVELLKNKQTILNKLIKSLSINKIDISNLSEEEKELRTFLNIDANGTFVPPSTSIVKDEKTPFEVYPAMVQKWTIEKFPAKKFKEEQEMFLKKDLEGLDEDEQLSFLLEQKNALNKEKNALENKINFIRLSSALMNKPVFLWEKQEIKAKKVTDKILENNMVVDEQAYISKKVINDINIKQEVYKVLIKAN